jgi:hypothetical protein
LFLDEARLCARLAHANIVTTVDVIDHPHGIGIVMEYVHSVLRGCIEPPSKYRPEVPGVLDGIVLRGLHATGPPGTRAPER